MKLIPATPEAYQLLHEGCLALSEVEANGMRVDLAYLDKAISRTGKEIRRLEEELKEDKVFRIWRRRFGERTKLGSPEQFGKVVFEDLGFARKPGTRSNDEEAFEGVDHPFVRKYFLLKKKQKSKGTYLEPIRREVEGEYLHCFFHLHLDKSYRGTSDKINYKNIPIRDPEAGKLIRSAFIARPNHVIIENDFGGIEVRGIACYNKDPVLIDYICDPSKDMHRDMGAKCYMLKKDQVSKTVRYCGKNMFVFPSFYGSYYVDCARNLWQAILKMGLETNDGVPVGQILEEKGITGLGACDPKKTPRSGTFEHHIKRVEDELWNTFKVYDRWRRDWWKQYLRLGYIKTLTGFILQGVYRRNQIINLPNQGSASHIKLMTLILLIKELRKRKMRSKVVGEIHDSIVGDVHRDEVDDYLALVKDIATEQVPNLWKWIIVPLEIEAEVAPEGGTWFDKKQVVI